MSNKDLPCVQFSLVICRNNKNQYLSVLECGNQGWWVPGGGVDPGETCKMAAIRETKQQAGVDIVLKGVLRIENSMGQRYMRQRVIYYAQPVDQNQIPKQFQDSQSILAKYMTVEEILALKSKWRGHELYDWANYVHKGGMIYPLDVLEQ